VIVELLARYLHGRTLRRAEDEMLVGEVIRCMGHQGRPLVALRTQDHAKLLRFLVPGDPLLFSISFAVDRITGADLVTHAVVGSKAALRVMAEVRRSRTVPGQAVEMVATDLANLLKVPLLGAVQVDHEMHRVFATTGKVVELQRFVRDGDEGRARLADLLEEKIGALREALTAYGEGSAVSGQPSASDPSG
jgi:hypothetical protein